MKKIYNDILLSTDSNTKEKGVKASVDCISSSYRKTTYFDEFGFAGSIERARFGFLPLGLAAKYSINRLIDSDIIKKRRENRNDMNFNTSIFYDTGSQLTNEE